MLQTGKMILYSWKVARGGVYTDFHGHDPEWGNKEAFVRYEEHQETNGGNGSLVTPFKGEHGWYWISFNPYPVTITLTLRGYFDKIKRYGDKG